MGFGFLRQSLAHHISDEFDYHYTQMYKNLFDNKVHIDWLNKYEQEHEEQQPIISALFFHSDCDGEWNKEEIDVLVEWLQVHKPKEQPDDTKRDFIEEYEGLLKMLQTPNLYKVIFC